MNIFDIEHYETVKQVAEKIIELEQRIIKLEMKKGKK